MSALQDGTALGVAMSKPTFDTLTVTGTVTNSGAVNNSGTVTNTGATNLATAAVTGASTAAPPFTIASTSTDTGAINSAGASVVETLTGIGGVGWAAKFDLEANVALGGYANGCYGYLAFGASGRITGLASGTVGEIVLSAACTKGTAGDLMVLQGFTAELIA